MYSFFLPTLSVRNKQRVTVWGKRWKLNKQQGYLQKSLRCWINLNYLFDFFFFLNNTTIVRFSSCLLWLRTDTGCFLLFIYSFRTLERLWLNSLQMGLKEADLHRSSLLCSLKFRFFPDWWIISSLLLYNSAAKRLRSESRSIRLPLQAASWAEARRNVLAQA